MLTLNYHSALQRDNQPTVFSTLIIAGLFFFPALTKQPSKSRILYCLVTALQLPPSPPQQTNAFKRYNPVHQRIAQ